MMENLKNEINNLSEHQIALDNNIKLLAEGTLNLSEKDKQYQIKLDNMRKDLSEG